VASSRLSGNRPIIYTSCHLLHQSLFRQRSARSAYGFSPRVAGKVHLSAASPFEQLGAENVWRFSFRVDQINRFEGETTRFAVDYAQIGICQKVEGW